MKNPRMKNLIVLIVICLLAFFFLSRQTVWGDYYALQGGQTLSSDLVINGGSASLEPGSRVTGSLWVSGGSLKANGQIDGDVIVTGGSIAFGASAAVRGSVRTTGGGIHVAEGASVPPIESYVIRPPAPVQAFLDSDLWHAVWPIAVLVPGLICLAILRRDRKRARGLAMPGSVLTTLGLIFLFQNTLNQFQTWAYAWVLVLPTSVGIGMYIEGSSSNQPGLCNRGMRIARIGLIAFVILAAFFEILINLSGLATGAPGRMVVSALLILTGGLLIVRRAFPRSATGQPLS